MVKEKRLIDANELYAQLEEIRMEYIDEDSLSSDFAANIIETVQDEYLAKSPTVDAVEVVRCEKCAKCLVDNSGRENHLCMKRPSFPVRVKLDGFCSDGERRNDG